MNENATRTQERIDLDDRDRRALEQYLTVLEDQGRVRGVDDLYLVVSQSGSEYLVDAREGSCECPDFEHRDIECKHLRRVQLLRGDRPLPAHALEVLDVDPNLGEHVAASPTFVASDGGVVETAADDGAEIIEDGADPWKGPFHETDKYGELTGAKYYRCRDCGREVHEEIDRDRVEHRDGCRFAGGDDR